MASEEHTCYRIICEKRDYELCRAETIQDLFEKFCQKINRHNHDMETIHETVKNELTWDNARSGFSSGAWTIETGRLEKEMVFDE